MPENNQNAFTEKGRKPLAHGGVMHRARGGLLTG